MEDFAPMQEVMLEFRAGKMHVTGTRVAPDNRKGLVRVGRGEEGLIHLQWLDRTRAIVEDDQIIFPDEASFEKVNQSSDRVFILKFHSDSSRKSFFWMQEPQSGRDMEICNMVNFYINRPLVLPDEEEAEASVPLQMSEKSEDTAEDETSSRAGNLVEQSIASELISEATSAGPVQLSDLQRILHSIRTDAVGEHDTGLGLGDLLRPDLVLPLIEILPLQQRLTCYLPEGSWTPEDIMDLLQSPPFRQQVETFSHVLRTGQIDLSQFGIDPSKYKFTVLSFLEALEDSVGKTSGSNDRGAGEDDSQSHRSSGGDAMEES